MTRDCQSSLLIGVAPPQAFVFIPSWSEADNRVSTPQPVYGGQSLCNFGYFVSFKYLIISFKSISKCVSTDLFRVVHCYVLMLMGSAWMTSLSFLILFTFSSSVSLVKSRQRSGLMRF